MTIVAPIQGQSEPQVAHHDSRHIDTSMTNGHHPRPSIYDLPPELIDSILTFVEPAELQSTALSLKQAFPDFHVSDRHLFRHLRVGRPEQMRPMWDRLTDERHSFHSSDESNGHQSDEKERGTEGLLRHVQSFSLASFSGDADILNNILRLVPLIQRLNLNLGTNFAPEHLAECFEIKRRRIEGVEIRFRPYVDRATYYQFLKVSRCWFQPKRKGDLLMLNISNRGPILTLPSSPCPKNGLKHLALRICLWYKISLHDSRFPIWPNVSTGSNWRKSCKQPLKRHQPLLLQRLRS